MEDIKEKTAEELFSELGYEKQEIYYNSDIENVIYFINDQYSSNIEFKYSAKLVRVYYGENKAGNFNMNILQIINKKCQELRLVRR